MDGHLDQLLEVTADLHERTVESSSDVVEAFEKLHASERTAVAHVHRALSQLSGTFDADSLAERNWTREERTAAELVLRRMASPVLVDVSYSLDFLLELRNSGLLVNEFPNVVFFLILVSGREALDRENHGMGFHFHYVSTSGRVPARTNVLLTFDPKESGPPDTLYWEYHSRYHLTADPSRWGTRRARAVHSAAQPSLLKPGKQHFRPPSESAATLYAE